MKSLAIAKSVQEGTELKPARTCYACAFSYMEPSDPTLVCGHKDAGTFGKYVRGEPAKHCGDYTKFEQHPRRNSDGSLKP